jgi:molecular chaperone DnaK (HSP70)
VFGLDDNTNIISWGYAVSPEHDIVSLFKLLLAPSSVLPQSTSSSPLFKAVESKIRDLHKSAMELVSMYLGELWDHFVVSDTISAEDPTGLQIYITIPAGWPDSVRKQMTGALDKAGIITWAPGCRVEYLREPQAAAHAMVHDLQQQIKLQVRVPICIQDSESEYLVLTSFSRKVRSSLCATAAA